MRDEPVAPVEAQSLAAPPPRQAREVTLMENERVIFVDEVTPGRHLRVIASGEVDEELLDALEDFTKRRRKRLLRPTAPLAVASPPRPDESLDDL